MSESTEATGREADFSSVPHSVAAPDQWPWLPRATNGTLARHAYCTDCGQVRADGAARAMDMGGIVNLLTRLYRILGRLGRKVTEAQHRLIVRRLSAEQADDPFALSRDHQFHLVSRVVASYLAMPADAVESYLRSC